MSKRLVTFLGKSVKKVAALRGGGSALPGLVVERIDPKFVSFALADLPYGVVVISGTNGKTTTTKMVVELLEGQGLKVFTNRTGSNFSRGVVAALLGEVNSRGKLSADIAVLELDEAHAVKFVQTVQPTYSLLLNVMRDQLDRFGEIDKTADMLRAIAESTTRNVVINRDDPRLSSEDFRRSIDAQISTYGVSHELLKLFPSDDSLKDSENASVSGLHINDTELIKVDGQSAKISFADSEYDVELKLSGVYNILNSVGAVALVRHILNDELDTSKLFQDLSNILPAFGRGEKLLVNGQPLELVLVKNPSGFRLGLKSFNPTDVDTMIAINDNYADGRDMSWLWDVDFTSLPEVRMVSGIRAYDMALRLDYDDVKIAEIEVDLVSALANFIKSSDKPKRIYCTYTAMLTLRKELSKLTDVETIR